MEASDLEVTRVCHPRPLVATLLLLFEDVGEVSGCPRFRTQPTARDWCQWCQQTNVAFQVKTEFGLQMDSTEVHRGHRNRAKSLKTCGGQGRPPTALPTSDYPAE